MTITEYKPPCNEVEEESVTAEDMELEVEPFLLIPFELPNRNDSDVLLGRVLAGKEKTFFLNFIIYFRIYAPFPCEPSFITTTFS